MEGLDENYSGDSGAHLSEQKSNTGNIDCAEVVSIAASVIPDKEEAFGQGFSHQGHIIIHGKHSPTRSLKKSIAHTLEDHLAPLGIP